MPKLTVDGVGEFEVPTGKRLVNALVDDCGVDQLHACGGFGRCTTCRVRVGAGLDELPLPSDVEREALNRIHADPNVRLACQRQLDDLRKPKSRWRWRFDPEKADRACEFLES